MKIEHKKFLQLMYSGLKVDKEGTIFTPLEVATAMRHING
jgi:hypothetical protein